jgi:hypothetical protein
VIYISNTIHDRLRIEICGIPLHKGEGYWRVHPDHRDIVEVFVDKAFKKLHPQVKYSRQVALLTVDITLLGVRRLPKGIDGI